MAGKLKKKSLPFQTGVVGDVSFTVGAEATNVVNVAGQVKDENGKAITQRVMLHVWLSDVATGLGLCAVAPSGTVVIGTNGTILASIVAKTCLLIQTDASGRFDLNITEAGAKTLYVGARLPDGTFKVSSVATWT